MSDTKLLTREEALVLQTEFAKSTLLKTIVALYDRCKEFEAEVEGLERDNADLSAYADKKEAEVKRFVAEIKRMLPVVEAAREWNEYENDVKAWKRHNATVVLKQALKETEGDA